MKKFIIGIKNLWKFKTVIWNYRWWDFGYFLDIIEIILEDWTKHYGKDSHFIGDEFVRLRACVLLKQLKEYKNTIDTEKESERLKKFCKTLSKNLERFWD